MNRWFLVKEGGAKASVLLATDSSSGAEMSRRRSTMVHILCTQGRRRKDLAPRFILIPAYEPSFQLRPRPSHLLPTAPHYYHGYLFAAAKEKAHYYYDDVHNDERSTYCGLHLTDSSDILPHHLCAPSILSEEYYDDKCQPG